MPAPHRRRLPTRRRAACLGLAVGVAALHLWLADQVLDDRLGSGAAARGPKRIEVAFVRELQQQLPAALAPLPAAAPVRRRAAPVAAAASAPALPALIEPIPALAAFPAAPVPVAPPVAPEPQPLAEAPPPMVAVASLPAAMASAPAAFEWPPSTRLSYRLTGHYRGPVEGQARVEWVREGYRYQVHLDVQIGPSFAPLLTRRMTSDGDLTADGLRPRRYDEETRMALRSPRALTLLMGDTQVRLPSGQELLRPSGLQDTASQFVQMTWMFTLDPSRLQPGRSFVMPLALPRRVEDWTYDVVGRETLVTPAGNVEAFHVKPRREAKAGGDLTAEMWIAPSLQYLPVRIVIRQDADNHADLLIERLPQQALAASAPGR